MAEQRPSLNKKIGCQQVLLRDSSVFSIQWMVLPQSYSDTLSPSYLLERYLNYIRFFTLSLIRPCRTDTQMEFRLLNSRISLISFTYPTFVETDLSQSASIAICGGVLVQGENCHRGELSFITKPVKNGLKVILQLSDYCPFLLGSDKPSRWRKLFYRMTQAYIHKIVTVRFLARLYHDLEGVSPSIRVVKVKVMKGEDT
jgi:hypothetical protein